MDAASPTADRIVGSEHSHTQVGMTLAGKLFATLWTTARLEEGGLDTRLEAR